MAQNNPIVDLAFAEGAMSVSPYEIKPRVKDVTRKPRVMDKFYLDEIEWFRENELFIYGVVKTVAGEILRVLPKDLWRCRGKLQVLLFDNGYKVTEHVLVTVSAVEEVTKEITIRGNKVVHTQTIYTFDV